MREISQKKQLQDKLKQVLKKCYLIKDYSISLVVQVRDLEMKKIIIYMINLCFMIELLLQYIKILKNKINLMMNNCKMKSNKMSGKFLEQVLEQIKLKIIRNQTNNIIMEELNLLNLKKEHLKEDHLMIKISKLAYK